MLAIQGHCMTVAEHRTAVAGEHCIAVAEYQLAVAKTGCTHVAEYVRAVGLVDVQSGVRAIHSLMVAVAYYVFVAQLGTAMPPLVGTAARCLAAASVIAAMDDWVVAAVAKVALLNVACLG